MRDITKLVNGLCLSRKKTITSRDDFFKLWIHECTRTFSDRLVDRNDKDSYWNVFSSGLEKGLDLARS
jgi:hypothetical protein